MNQWDGIDEFVAVAQMGSFSAGAQRLRVSSSHVSRQVAQLETRLGERLFYRTTRKVALTPAGQELLSRCAGLVAARDEALAAISNMHETPRGLLRLTCAAAYGERFVVPLVNDFLERYPAVEVDIHLTNKTVDIVQDKIDLAIRMGRLRDSGLVVTRLVPRVMYLCAAPSYLAEHGVPRSLGDLPRHRCLIGSSDTWLFSDGGKDWAFQPAGRWRCNNGYAVLDAALRGFGLCHLPDYYVREHIESGRLVSLLDDKRHMNMAVWAVTAQQRQLSSKVRLLVEHLKAGLAARPEYRQG
ncbi:LysR family transcriptional regulator [Telmatospirillum sp. J64-1]|uniref:LysR family transcriptional regulator n=1 Tax=Telmatospirillum sp. J64-1 TaxID=2502183 RepID=UPI00115F508B|nr:LysR family transcriptional regulator [Telmatospirillum sp. J64-1]